MGVLALLTRLGGRPQTGCTLMETGLLIQTTRTLQICLPVVTLSHGSGCGGGETTTVLGC